jgi:hypothetical protein
VGISTLVVLVGGLLLTPVVSHADEPVEFRVLDLGRTATAPVEPGDFVIRNERQWCEFVDEIYGGLPPTPCGEFDIDFRRENVIASTLGARPNGCYFASIRSITRVSGPRRLHVVVSELFCSPGPRLCSLHRIIYPIAAVVVSKPLNRVEFVHPPVVPVCR